MINNSPKYRWKLNKEQLEVLELLYRFRFASSDLIAQYFGKKSGVFVYKRLRILQDQGLIEKRYDNSYRIQGKPAAYYLTPAGGRELKGRRDIEKQDEINITRLYKISSLSDDFVAHSFDLLAIRNRLSALYGAELRFFTKSDFLDIDYFPKQLPDAYIRIKNADDLQFFLYLCHDSQLAFATVKKLKDFITYAENGDWEITESALPKILVICDSSALQKRLQKNMMAVISGAWNDEAIFALTSKPGVLSDNAAIWHLVSNPDEPLTLRTI